MALTRVQTDLLDGLRITSNQGGFTVVRKEVWSSNIPLTASTLAVAGANTPNPFPHYSDVLNGTLLICNNVDIAPCDSSNKTFWVTATFGLPTTNNTPTGANTVPDKTTPGVFKFGASTSEVETSRDKDQNEMVLGIDLGGSYTKQQPGKAKINLANPYMSVTRREPTIDFDKVLTYTGRVNTSAWLPASVLSGPRTWLCTSIDYAGVNGVFEVTYNFQYRGLAWDVTLTYQDPETSAPILTTDARYSVTQSRKTFKIYQEADFNLLKLF